MKRFYSRMCCAVMLLSLFPVSATRPASGQLTSVQTPTLPYLADADLATQLKAGGTVHLRPGRYILHQTAIVPGGERVVCDDPSTVLQAAEGVKIQNLLVLQGIGTSLSGCTLSSLKSTSLVFIGPNSHNILVTHNTFKSQGLTNGVAIDAPHLGNITIAQNRFVGVEYGVIQNVHSGDLVGLQITGNSFEDINADAVELNDPVSVNCCGMLLKVTAAQVEIGGNTMSVTRHAKSDYTTAGFCVGVAGAHDVKIHDNECTSWNEGIHIEDRAYNVDVIKNVITITNAPPQAAPAAILAIDGHNIRILNNTIRNTMGEGIRFDYSENHQVQQFSIQGNVIQGCTGHGIFVGAGSLGSADGEVSGNSVSGCSATSMLIWGSPGRLNIHDNTLDSHQNCAISYHGRADHSRVRVAGNKDADGVTPVADCDR